MRDVWAPLPREGVKRRTVESGLKRIKNTLLAPAGEPRGGEHAHSALLQFGSPWAALGEAEDGNIQAGFGEAWQHRHQVGFGAAVPKRLGDDQDTALRRCIEHEMSGPGPRTDDVRAGSSG